MVAFDSRVEYFGPASTVLVKILVKAGRPIFLITGDSHLSHVGYGNFGGREME